MKRFVYLILVLAMLLSVAAGCTTEPAAPEEPEAPTGPVQGGTLVVGHISDPMTYNPDFKPDDMAMIVISNIMNKIVTLDYDYNVIPDLADTWEISEDGMTYTFHLAENIMWHDGVKFTSADVKWTYDTIISESGVMANNMSAIEEVICPDDNTVVLQLSRPDAPLLGILGWYGTFILPKHIYEGTDWTENPANQDPIGTGPFKFVEHNKGENVTIEANPDYFNGAPYLDKVVFAIIPDQNTALQALLNGEIDSMGSMQPSLAELPALKENDSVKVIQKPTPSRDYMPFNFDREPWTDLAVRQAVGYAIDRDEIVKKSLKGVGTVAEGFYSPSIAWAYNDTDVLPAMDVEKANQLLDDAGYAKDADGIRFSCELPYFTARPQYADMGLVIKNNLAEIGIEVVLVQYEMAAWMENVFNGQDFDITLLAGGWGPDPSNLVLRIGTDGGFNFSNYGNPEVDALLAEAALLSDVDQRAILYKQAQTILSNDLPFIPLSESQIINVYNSNMHGHPMGEALGKVTMNGLSQAWLETK